MTTPTTVDTNHMKTPLSTIESEVLSLVQEFNEKTEELGHGGKLKFGASGYTCWVTWFGETVWDDDDFRAPWNEECTQQMPLRQWFETRIKEIRDQVAGDCEMMLQNSPLEVLP